MPIIRVRKDREHPYFTANATSLNDTTLSWAAKGMHMFFLSKPDNWTINVTHLIKCSTDGKDKVYTLLAELEKHGYLVRICTRGDDGKFKWEQHIYETPVPPEQRTEKGKPANFPAKMADSPYTAQPDTVQPYTVNPEALVITDRVITEGSSTEAPSTDRDRDHHHHLMDQERQEKDDDDDERRVEKAKDILSPPQRLSSTEEPTEPVEVEPTVIDPPHILAFDGTPPEAQAIKDTLLTTLNHVRVEVARRNNLPAPPPRRELSRSDRETLDKWLAYAQEQDLSHEDLTEAIQSTLTEVSERCKTVPGGAAYYLQPVFEAMQYQEETRKAKVVHELNIDRTQALLAEYAAAREAKTRSKNGGE